MMWPMGDTVLEVENISKIYTRKQKSNRQRLATTLLHILLGSSGSSNSQLIDGEFYSLNKISFSLNRGEAIGVIGLNGAGKTTLLRMLAGQILPDEGEIRILGESAAMIDLTAGFQMNSTGRQNIYLRCAMLGRSQELLASTVDDIIDFTDLGDAIDAPIATYSSGMLMRLAFSIMVAMSPDVLFIDEILSVGDFQFRQKCLARIRELRERAAIVLVSHSMGDIRRFCDRVIVLQKGRLIFQGEPDIAIETYEKQKTSEQSARSLDHSEILGPQYHNSELISDLAHYWCDRDGNPVSEIRSLETLYFKATFTISGHHRNPIMGIPVWTDSGEYVTGFSTEREQFQMNIKPGEKVSVFLKVENLAFNPGVYVSNFGITDGPEFLYRGENPTLRVLPSIDRYWGLVSLPHSWHSKIE